MNFKIHPTEALSDGVCPCCLRDLGEDSFFVLGVESIITRETNCPPLHRDCSIFHAATKADVVAIWKSEYRFEMRATTKPVTVQKEPVFFLEAPLLPLSFWGKGDHSPEALHRKFGEAWLSLQLGEDGDRMGQAALALLPQLEAVAA